jgi:hypothetical protein
LNTFQAWSGIHEEDLRDHRVPPNSRLYQKTLEIRLAVDRFLLKDLQTLQRGRSARLVRESEIPRWQGCVVPEEQMEKCVEAEAFEAIDVDSVCANPKRGVAKLLDQRRFSSCARFVCTNPAAGFAKGGLCWWHSKFQQRSWQLAVFAPEKPLLSVYEMQKRLGQLFRANTVVEFPGVSNWAEFSFLYRDLILQFMLREQFADALRPTVWRQWAKGPVSGQKAYFFGRQIEESLKHGASVFIYLKNALTAQHAYVAYAAERRNRELRIKILDSNDPLNKVTALVFRENEATQNAEVFVDDTGDGDPRFSVPLRFRWASWQPKENGLNVSHLEKAWRNHCENKTIHE